MAINQKIKLLIVDDSIFFRKALAGALAGDQRVEVVGQAVDALDAMEKIKALNPDVVTLDVEMPKLNGIDFLKKLCQDAGISIKATDGKLVLYDQATYEAKAPVLTIENGAKGGYIKYKLHSGSADTQYAKCRVRYQDPGTGTCIEGTAEDSSVSGDQCLEITAKVGCVGEAQTLAKKHLRLHNKLAKTATFTLPGDVGLVAGVTVELKGWGGWDGKYIVTRAVHTIGSGGYTTQISIRKVLGY